MRWIRIWPLSALANWVGGSGVRHRLARGAFWSLTGAVISRGLMLVALIVVARTIGRDIFGEFGIVRSTAGLFQVFGGFGMAMTATKHVAEFREKDPAKAGRIIMLSGAITAVAGALVSAGLIVLAPLIATHALAAPHLTGPLRISAGFLFFGVLSVAQTGGLSGFEAFRSIARVNLIAGLLSFPIVVGGVSLGGLEGALWALVVSAALNWFIGHLALRAQAERRNVPLSLRGWRAESGVLWRFSLPAALSAMMVPPVHWVCSALLVNQPEGYAEMGIYSAGEQWRIALLFLPGYLSAAVVPVLSSLHGEGDRRRYKKVLWMNTLVTTGATLPVFLVIWPLASWIMRFYGPGFEDGSTVLIVLAATACVMSFGNSIGKAILSTGRMWSNLLLSTLWAVTLVSLAARMVQRGALGLALALLIAYSIHLVSGLLLMRFVLFRREDPARVEEESRG